MLYPLLGPLKRYHKVGRHRSQNGLQFITFSVSVVYVVEVVVAVVVVVLRRRYFLKLIFLL
jgi:hypothetical protein